MNDLLTIVSEFERLSKEATPGPWYLGVPLSNPSRVYIAHRSNGLCMESAVHFATDFNLCIYTRNNADTLVEQVRALSEENERLKGRFESFVSSTRVYINSIDVGDYEAMNLLDEIEEAEAALADKGATS